MYVYSDSIYKEYIRLCVHIIESGIKERDYFDMDKEWLEEMCNYIGIDVKVYYDAMEYIYGPRNKNEENAS